MRNEFVSTTAENSFREFCKFAEKARTANSHESAARNHSEAADAYDAFRKALRREGKSPEMKKIKAMSDEEFLAALAE